LILNLTFDETGMIYITFAVIMHLRSSADKTTTEHSNGIVKSNGGRIIPFLAAIVCPEQTQSDDISMTKGN